MSSSNRSVRWLSRAAAAAALAAIAAFSGGAAAQQPAGRVLIAVGTVSIERGTERIPAAAGTEVLRGDTLQVGPQSNLQVRMIDESVIALRADTTFRISEFNFDQQAPEKGSVLMNLIKGGMRTVTGLIGKSDQKAYGVVTPTATVGIRGTHYTLRVCNDDCFETTGTTTTTTQAARVHLVAAEGSASDAGPIAQLAQANPPVPNGTYGSVTDGRISVSNQSGVREFGADQYFRVASATAEPQQLIGPPSFLRDRLEGRGRAAPQRTSGQKDSSSGSSGSSASAASSTAPSGSESAPTVAPTGAGGGSGDSRVSSSVVSPALPVAITPTLTQEANKLAIAGPAAVVQLTASSATNVYRLAGTSLNIPVTCSVPPCGSVTRADLIVSVNPTSQTARIVLAIEGSGHSLINANNNYGDFPVTISNGQITISGSANLANHPTQQGSFRCSDCGPGNSPGFLDSTAYTVTISGNQATLTFTGTDPAAGGGGSFTFTAPLTLSAPANGLSAVIAGRNIGVNGGANFYVQANAAGQPVFIGEPLQIGNNLSSIGAATNTTLGSSPATGNLSWGTWTGSATGVNFNYAPFTQLSGSVSPWIIGDLTSVLPASLGTVTFTPFVSVIGNGASVHGTLNSASMTADFVNRNLALSINATNAPGGGTYQMNGNAAFSAINGRFAAGFGSITCTGVCGTGPQGGSFNGFFAGANATGAGVGFNAASTGTAVFGVVGFKR